MEEEELIATARSRGYELVHDGGMWRIRDAARSFQPCSPDRTLVVGLLADRVRQARLDPRTVDRQ